MPCPYAFLGLDPDAPDFVVEAVARAWALRYHPDKKGGDAHLFKRSREACEAIEAGTPLSPDPVVTKGLTDSLRTIGGLFRKRP